MAVDGSCLLTSDNMLACAGNVARFHAEVQSLLILLGDFTYKVAKENCTQVKHRKPSTQRRPNVGPCEKMVPALGNSSERRQDAARCVSHMEPCVRVGFPS